MRLRSSAGWVLASAHACWFVLAVANMSPPDPGLGRFLDMGGGSSATLFAGRPFHFVYESLALRCLMLADLPALIALSPIEAVLLPFLREAGVGSFALSYVGAGLLLLVSTVQWMLVARALPDLLSRWSRAVIAAILAVTLLAAPLVNARSRQLGFRHAGISLTPPAR